MAVPALGRRAFVRTTGLGILTSRAARVAHAARPPVRVGVLRPVPPGADALDAPINAVFHRDFEGFRQALHDEGFVEGRNTTIDLRFGVSSEELTKIADEFARTKVDVIAAISPASVTAVRSLKPTIPIVVLDLETDPVATGIVARLARPGANFTGVFLDFPELAGKWLEMLKEVTPTLSRVAVIWDPRTGLAQLQAAEAAARTLRLQLQPLDVRTPTDYEAGFRTATRERAGALLALSSPIFNTSRQQIAHLALKHRLPSIMPFPGFADDGGLLAYGPHLLTLFRQTGGMVVKVLKGTPPAELPVERPTRLEMSVNLKTAKTLGVTIPPSLRVRAERVIE
jgi:putative ABC transport system substrate-binding protein